MPAGISYSVPPEIERELCDIESIYRPKDGGCDLNIDGLKEGSVLPPFAPMFYDKSNHEAFLVKNVKVVEAANASATSVKIAKGSVIDGAIKLSDGENVISVSKIDKSNEDYDVLTVSELTAALPAKKVLTEATSASDATPKRTANRALYTRTKVVKGQTVTLIAQAYSIMEDNLYMPFSDADKETLTSRFMFI